MSHVVIIGSGDCPPAAVKESLADALSEGDEVSIAWPRSMNGGIGSILEYLVDNQYETNLLYSEGQNVHPDLRQIDTVNVVKVRDTTESLIKAIDIEVLVMWDDNESDTIEQVFDSGKEVRVRELSNGLSPLVVEYHPVVDTTNEEEEEEEVEDATRFTRDQLEDMAVPAVKRYGERLGLTSKTKAGIIDELFGSEDSIEDEPATDMVLRDEDTSPNREYKPTHTSSPTWDSELTNLIGDFFNHYKPGFESDMAHLALGQARLWMLRSLSRVEF